MVFLVKSGKSEHHHGILHIWISLGTRFKLTILSFWTKFIEKGYFQLKTEQAVHRLQAFAFCVVNVNSTVTFEHLKISKISLFWTFWMRNCWNCLSLASWALFIFKLYKDFQTTLCKQPWLVKPRLNFDLNFSIKSFYNLQDSWKSWNLWW